MMVITAHAACGKGAEMTIIRLSPAARRGMDASLARTREHLMSLSPKEHLHASGILSENF
jgi:hypothetical protein